ncbi:MAG: CDP-glycerol glycerophosphotransferase family protein [Treponemataceae bacterium]
MKSTFEKKYDKKEQKYIRMRRLKAFFESLFFYLCRIFPIDKNLISVCTFEGKGGFGCNPKYVVEELHRRNKNYKFVWFVNDLTRPMPEYVKKVSHTLWSRAYWLSKSKIWLDNYRKPYGTIKRKGQYYLNLNHYTIGIKCTGLYRGDGFSKMAYLVSKNDSDMVDDFVIDSLWCEKISSKALVYNGTYLKTGAPRCDVLYGDRSDYKKKFRKKHNLPENAKVLLFAPTFREGAQNGKRFVFSENWTIDFNRLIKNLETKFKGEWYICIRVHPQLASQFKQNEKNINCAKLIDESYADDMYEILAGMDAYISDYSSACFEAGFAKIPVFLYADDIERYTCSRGNLMWNMSTEKRNDVPNNKEITGDFDVKMPFTVATNNEELERDIFSFNKGNYEENLDTFYKNLGLVFNGNASAKLADKIEEKVNIEKIKPLLSVIVPVYNVEQYLHRCLDNLINQTYKNLEIILVDDGSTDSSGKICDEYAQKDSRIIVIHKENGGLVTARKAGINKATGIFAIHLDSDDWIEINAYEEMMKYAVKYDCDIVTSGCLRDYGNYVLQEYENSEKGFYEGTKLLELKSNLISIDTFFKSNLSIHIYNKLMKKDYLKFWTNKIDNFITIGEDAAVVYPAILNAKTLYVTEKNYYHYCLRGDSLMGTKNKTADNRLKIFLDNLQIEFFNAKANVKNALVQFEVLKMYYMLLRNPELIINHDGLCLFPFGNVKKEEKIVLYGAGKFGNALYVLLKSMGLNIVSRIDKKYQNEVDTPDVLKKIEYDKIIIGVLIYDVIENIKTELINNYLVSENSILSVSVNSILTLDKLKSN